jgi:predicted Zn-dependent protease
MGDHQSALKEIDAGLALEPDNPILPIFRSQVLFRQGETDAALSSARRTLGTNPHLEGLRPFLALLLAFQKRAAEAREQLTPIALERARADHDVAYWAASAYALLDEKEAAMKWLKRSIALGMENRNLFETDPTLAGLHEEHEFKEIMDRISTARVPTT